MRRALLFLSAAAALATPVWAGTPTTFKLPSDPNTGAEKFERFQCSKCHAIGGSANMVGPNLGRLELRMPLLDGAAHMWNHLPGMDRQRTAARLAPLQVNGDDVVNLVAFFTTYQYYVAHVGQPGQPARGAALFREKLCNRCHSVTPGETSKAPNLSKYGGGRSVLELAQTMWNHGSKMQLMLEKESVQRPSFREHEMADLLAFLATLGSPAGSVSAYIEPGSPARGAEVFVARGCARCHAVRGAGGAAQTPAGEEPPPDLGSHGEIALKDYTEIASQMWNHAVPMWGRMKRLDISTQPLQKNDLPDLVAYLFFVNLEEERGDRAKGEVIYLRLCAVCHGPDAAGKAELGVPPLPPATEETQWDFIAAMVRAGPKMEAQAELRGIEWPELRTSELRHLIAFLVDRSRAAPGEKK